MAGTAHPGPSAPDGAMPTPTSYMSTSFFLELFVYNPQLGSFDGAGIDRVEFNFDCPNGEQYRCSERIPPYCSLGGGEPNCTVERLRSGDMFPGSICEVTNDD